MLSRLCKAASAHHPGEESRGGGAAPYKHPEALNAPPCLLRDHCSLKQRLKTQTAYLSDAAVDARVDKLRRNYSIRPCKTLFITGESSVCNNLPGERCGGSARGRGLSFAEKTMSGVQQSLNRASGGTQCNPGVTSG